MSDVMAIISKAIFEKTAGKAPALGAQLEIDRYSSANKGLAPLEGGGRLFLVTVRPPDEALWLVAVLDNPTFTGSEWVASPSTTPLTDISALKTQLVFESGKGLPTKGGTLGMSLQTPRALTAADSALLLDAVGGAPASTSSAYGTPGAPGTDPAKASLAAVLAAPTDDGPKLALARYWRAIGEPRGELVEIDLELRKRLSVMMRRQLRARRNELLQSKHARLWWPWPIEHRQRGGFIVAVKANLDSFLNIAPELFAAEPVTEVELTDADEKSVAELAQARWLSRVLTLIVRGPIGDEGFATLVKSKQLASLQALNVSMNEVTGEGIAALANRLPALTRLVLTANPIGDEGAEALAAWKHLANVRTLYLSNCQLTTEGLRALLASKKLRALEKLTLAQSSLGDDGAGLFQQYSAELPNLRYLELKATDLGDGGAKAIAAARFPQIRHLDVRGNWCSRAELSATYRDALFVGPRR